MRDGVRGSDTHLRGRLQRDTRSSAREVILVVCNNSQDAGVGAGDLAPSLESTKKELDATSDTCAVWQLRSVVERAQAPIDNARDRCVQGFRSIASRCTPSRAWFKSLLLVSVSL